MNIYSIYKATNISNGKCYIGFTKNFDRRIKDHKKAYPRVNSNFYYAIRKYGWDSFEWEIIFQSEDLEYCKNTMEPYDCNPNISRSSIIVWSKKEKNGWTRLRK